MATAPASTLWRRFVLTLEMIKFEHSVFALPFALTGALLAWRESGFETAGLAARLGFIVLAMVGARSAAMTFNRLLDADIDARNPRTRGRHIPAGTLSRGFAFAFLFASCAVFVAVASGPGAGPRHRARGGLDRHSRLARLAHRLADTRRDALDGRIRHHLRLPGLRIRLRRGAVFASRPPGHRRRAVGSSRLSCGD